MKLVVGLGNPESRYSNTRHNLGFSVTDRLATRKGLTFEAGRGSYYAAGGVEDGFLLAKPTTGMNNSGAGVLGIAEDFDFSPEEMLVVYDDMDMELGTIRFRSGGSAGGHHGMESILYHYGSDRFPRLKLGINSERRGTVDADFVLSEFDEDELDVAEKMIETATDGVLEFIANDIESCMKKFNGSVVENDTSKESPE